MDIGHLVLHAGQRIDWIVPEPQHFWALGPEPWALLAESIHARDQSVTSLPR